MFRRVKFLLFTACLLLTTLGATNAPASFPKTTQVEVPAPLTMSVAATKAQQQQAMNMWTREARETAKPMAFPSMPSDLNEPETLEEEALAGEPGSSPGGKPNPNSLAVAKSEFPEDWNLLNKAQAVEEAMEPEGTAAVYTGYLGNYYSQMWKNWPYETVGKLYFSTPLGKRTCTASVISSHNIIVTAAQCVYDTENNKWYSNWAFAPAARVSTAPFGKFPWVNARVLSAWVNASGTVRRYDVALIRLGNNSYGRPVTYYTGWFGRSWNYDYVQHHHAIGYPNNIHDGYYSYFCAAESYQKGTDVLGMGCNMTYGSSGGPWVRRFAPYYAGSNNYVNSVVSGGTPGTNTFYGPRFSTYNIVPLCNDEGC